MSRYSGEAAREGIPLIQRLGLEARRVGLAAREGLLRLRLSAEDAVRHLHGPTRPRADDRSLLVLCVLRNAIHWLPTFLRHYRELGARHFVFLDNGSTDGTRGLLRRQDDVSLFRTDLPFSAYGIVLKRWLVRRFGRGGWSLVADADELFDYPWSGRLSLRDFLGYLNHRGYDAVSVHNLEMISDEPLSEIQGRKEEDLRPLYPWYDVSDIRERRDKYYLAMNRLGGRTERHAMHTGGVRESGFGWSGSMLTKQALLRYRGEMDLFPFDGHFVTGARIADVTALFRHYKFVGCFFRHVREEVQREEHWGDAQIFKRYARVLREEPDLRLTGPDARLYGRAEDLLEDGFLIASEPFRRWVGEHARGERADAAVDRKSA